VDLTARTPEFVSLAKGVIVERFYSTEFEPVYFDHSRSGRLNAPDGSYGVLYAAEQLRGAFAETFLREPGRTLLALDFLRKKARVRLETTRELRLIKLAGRGLGLLGATAEVVHGGLPYDVSQAWSKALREHPSRPDGIAYHARHDDEAICYAIFDHAPLPVAESSRETDIDQEWFWREAFSYGIGLAPE
jgi:hypothetical protein